MPKTLSITEFGGINTADTYTRIVGPAFTAHEGGLSQTMALDSPDMLNMDFVQGGIKKRNGHPAWGESCSVELHTLVATATDEILAISVLDKNYAWYMVAVGKKQIYIRSSDITATPWQVAKIADGTSAYAHADSPTNAAKITLLDDRLFIGIEGQNYIQVFSGAGTGDKLDNQLQGGATGTTVDADSAAAQKVLNVAATTGFSVHDRIVIDKGGANEEVHYIASITAGASFTLYENLSDTHTAGDAHTVAQENLYVDYGGVSQTITGAWDKGAYIVETIQNSLAFTTSSNLLNYTPTPDAAGSGIWDGTNNEFLIMGASIRSVTAFAPFMSDSFTETLYIGTETGLFLYAGVLGAGQLVNISGAPSPAGFNTAVRMPNWLVYLSIDRRLVGVNGVQTVELGRKLNTKLNEAFVSYGLNADIENNRLTSPLTADTTVVAGDVKYVIDELDTATFTLTVLGELIVLPSWYDITVYDDPAFGIYLSEKKQLWFFYSKDMNGLAGPKNARCAMLDFTSGGMGYGIAQEGIDIVVKHSHWQLGDDDNTTDWIIAAANYRGKIFGANPDGHLYRLNPDDGDETDTDMDDGTNDVDILSHWKTPPLTAGILADRKQWLALQVSFDKESLAWDAEIDSYLDFDGTATDSTTIALNGGSRAISEGTVRLNRTANAIEIKISNNEGDETFTLRGLQLSYEYGVSIRN